MTSTSQVEAGPASETSGTRESWQPVYASEKREPNTPQWVVDHIKTGYHRAPNQLQATKLNGYTVAVANYVLSRTEWAERQGNGLAKARLAVTWISTDLGYSQKTVRGALRKLKAFRVLAYDDRHHIPGKRDGSTVYWLRPQPEWSDALHSREIARSVAPSRCTTAEARKLRQRIELYEARQLETHEAEPEPTPEKPRDTDKPEAPDGKKPGQSRRDELKRKAGHDPATQWLLADRNVDLEAVEKEIPEHSSYAGRINDGHSLFRVWLQTGLHWLVLWYLARAVEHVYRKAGIPVTDPQALLLSAAQNFTKWRERLPKPSAAVWGRPPQKRAMGPRDDVPTLRLPSSKKYSTTALSTPVEVGLWRQLARREKRKGKATTDWTEITETHFH